MNCESCGNGSEEYGVICKVGLGLRVCKTCAEALTNIGWRVVAQYKNKEVKHESNRSIEEGERFTAEGRGLEIVSTGTLCYIESGHSEVSRPENPGVRLDPGVLRYIERDTVVAPGNPENQSQDYGDY